MSREARSMLFYFSVALVFSIESSTLITVGSSALPSPVQCGDNGCTFSNYQGIWLDRTPCKAAKVLYPTVESELIDSVAEAVKNHLKVKVVSESSNSFNKIACPGGDNGLLISTRDYASTQIVVNRSQLTATVDAGVQLRDFVQELAKHGLTIPHTPNWDGVSMAGVIATGSHGSGFWSKGSVISEYVAGVRMVVPASPEEGYAKVVEVTGDDEALKAARMSLGVLGAVSKVTFSVMPMFKRSVTLDTADDGNLEQQIAAFSKAHDFPAVFWIPSALKVILRKEDKVPLETEGEGDNKFPLLLPMRVSHAQGMRAHQDSIETMRDVEGMCKLGENMVRHRIKSADGLLNDGVSFDRYPVIGLNHLMQTSGGCQTSPQEIAEITPTGVKMVADSNTDWFTCKWDPRIRGFFTHHTSVSIPFSKLPEFILDVKNLRKLNPSGVCSLNMFGGLSIRFVSKSDSYLGEKEDAAVVEFIYYRARDQGTPRLNEDVMEEIEQILVFKYGGKPHWGKNRDIAFEAAGAKVVNLAKFLEVKEELDPEGLFSSEWTDAILGIGKGPGGREVATVRDYCALEGLCICSEDSHCAPRRGYFCEQGLIYEEARVCRYDPDRTVAAEL